MPGETPEKNFEQPPLDSFHAMKMDVLSQLDILPRDIPVEGKEEQYVGRMLDAVSRFYNTFTPSEESKAALEEAKKKHPPQPRQKFTV